MSPRPRVHVAVGDRDGQAVGLHPLLDRDGHVELGAHHALGGLRALHLELEVDLEPALALRPRVPGGSDGLVLAGLGVTPHLLEDLDVEARLHAEDGHAVLDERLRRLLALDVLLRLVLLGLGLGRVVGLGDRARRVVGVGVCLGRRDEREVQHGGDQSENDRQTQHLAES